MKVLQVSPVPLLKVTSANSTPVTINLVARTSLTPLLNLIDQQTSSALFQIIDPRKLKVNY